MTTITSYKHQTKQNTTSFKKMLSKFGDNHPQNERAIFSVAVLKINKQEHSQKRILLLTNNALYNIKPNKTYTCQRRIPYDLIESVSVSTISDEFVIHIPTQYDYRYKSIYKNVICTELAKLCNKHRKTNIDLIKKINQDNLIMITCTKKQANDLTAEQRKERLKIYYSLINESNQIESNNNYNYNHYKEMSALNEKIFHKKNTNITTNHCTNNNIFGEQTNYENVNDKTGIDDINIHSDGDIVGDINTINHIGEHTITPNINFNYKMYTKKHLLIEWFFHSINFKKMDVPTLIMDCCLLYLSLDNNISDCFDSKTNDIWSDLVIFDDNNQTIALYDEYNGRTVYGTYIAQYNDHINKNIFSWKLRINDIDEYNGSVWIGIECVEDGKVNYNECFSRCNGCDNYSFGGSNLMGYNIWNRDKVIIMDNEPCILETGDWVEVILDFNRQTVSFVVNCDDCYVIENIKTKNKKYRLAVSISNISISLKEFNNNVFQTMS